MKTNKNLWLHGFRCTRNGVHIFFFNVSQSALLVYFHLVVSEINFPKSRYSSHTIKQNKLNYNLFLGNK